MGNTDNILQLKRVEGVQIGNLQLLSRTILAQDNKDTIEVVPVVPWKS